jgi:ribosomal protein S25
VVREERLLRDHNQVEVDKVMRIQVQKDHKVLHSKVQEVQVVTRDRLSQQMDLRVLRVLKVLRDLKDLKVIKVLLVTNQQVQVVQQVHLHKDH